MPEPTSFVPQARRVRSEAAIVAAFETVLLREGAGGVTIQGIAKEAGTAKTLIYKYFDSIEGLIKAWAKQREIFLPLEELFPDPVAAAEALQTDPYGFAKMQILKQARHMREHPVFIELCVAELSGSSPVVDALRELRRERNEAESKALGKSLDGAGIPMLMPLLLLPAAITYLAMRARRSPLYIGQVQLDTDEGWAQIMGSVEQLIDLISLASRLGDLANTDQQTLVDKFLNISAAEKAG